MPTYRNWTLVRHHRGKSFLATPKLYKAESALYFPNMQGYTLADPKNYEQDTIRVFRGKFTIVRMCCEHWSVEQCDSFTHPKEHPALAAEIERLKDKGLQVVQINIEEDRFRAWLVRWYLSWQREQVPKENWHRWFVITKGANDYMRRDINMPNPKVGQIYLLDRECKIRWAGCGDANDDEKDSLVKAVRKLVEPPVKEVPGKGKPHNKLRDKTTKIAQV